MAGADDDWDDEFDLVAALAPAARRPRWLPAQQALSPARWPAPRQLRPRFPWPPDRPSGSGEVAARCLAGWAEVTIDLDVARQDAGLPMRAWAGAAGVPLSSVDGLLRGRAWPSWRTLGRCAAVVGRRPQLVPDARFTAPLRPLQSRLAGPDRHGMQAAAYGDPGLLAAAWHNAAVAQLRWYARATGLTGTDIAATLHLRAATWSAARPSAPAHWVSLPVLLAVGDLLGQTLQLTDPARAWPLAAWEKRRP